MTLCKFPFYSQLNAPPSAFSLAIGEVACSSSETVMFCQQLEAETQMQAPGFPHDP